MLVKFGFIFFVLLVGVIPATAQSEQALIAKLTKNNSKRWIFEKMVKTMGSKCVKGEEWVFSSNKKVNVFKCENGDIMVQSFNWSLKRESALDVALTIGDKTYVLTFPPKQAGKERMRLRIRAQTMNQYTVDLLFKT